MWLVRAVRTAALGLHYRIQLRLPLRLRPGRCSPPRRGAVIRRRWRRRSGRSRRG
ncbi:hypothetical protein LT493_28975 [Streptomyces tricolor]|nr:hypothetical protein [Streptomyces tricolor]